jgi:hypothetical protein
LRGKFGFYCVPHNFLSEKCAGDRYVWLDIEDELGHRKDNGILQAAQARERVKRTAEFYILFFFLDYF